MYFVVVVVGYLKYPTAAVAIEYSNGMHCTPQRDLISVPSTETQLQCPNFRVYAQALSPFLPRSLSCQSAKCLLVTSHENDLQYQQFSSTDCDPTKYWDKIK